MMPWTRPDPHDDFAADAAKLLADVRDAVDKRKGIPHGDDFKDREIWTASWKRRDQTPGLHKRALVGPGWPLTKCAWCEQIRATKREIDVEHYRPKVWLTEWQGQPPVVSDTPPREIDVGPGYWWLAFGWSNYLLSCAMCNQHWKRNLFPVAAPRPACAEGVERTERPLLLDPASGFRTRDHFRWTVDGIMEPLSPEGYATIVTCGLNRADLSIRRGKMAFETARTLDAFVRALRRGDGDAQRQAFQKLGDLGSRSSEFTGMVRWLVEERLHHAWDELEGMPP